MTLDPRDVVASCMIVLLLLLLLMHCVIRIVPEE
jgi:preprotein translocase subunit Sec61beta